MGLLDNIKNDVKKSGTNKGKFLYFKEGVKVRVRFLVDMEDGMEVKFHDSFSAGINVPCQEIFGRNCEYCENEDLRTRSMYIWPVWDYEAKEVKLLMAAVNNCSPIPALVAFYDTYGTLLDRDYVVTKSGKQQNTTYAIVPMDKVKFRNDKAKPYSEKAILKMLDKAYPADNADDDDDEKPAKPAKKPGKASKAKVGGDEEDYDSMSAKELYDLCVDKDIEVMKRQDKQYYIDRLNDSAEDAEEDWGDEDDGEKEVSYDDMTARELYDLCKERDIECVAKKPEKYYIRLLEDNDKAQEDWGDEGDDGDGDDWGE